MILFLIVEDGFDALLAVNGLPRHKIGAITEQWKSGFDVVVHISI